MDDIHRMVTRIGKAIEWDVVRAVNIRAGVKGEDPGFGIPRQVFCFIDFLGGIAYSDGDGGTTTRSVQFLREFFPERYHLIALLLVQMWRHGTVHQWRPIDYYTDVDGQRVIVQWFTNSSDALHNRIAHLKTFRTSMPGLVYLVINICQLADDLVQAFHNFADKMREKKSYGDDCLQRYEALIAAKNCMEFPKLNEHKKEQLRQEIIQAHKSIAGELDSLRQVKKWY